MQYNAPLIPACLRVPSSLSSTAQDLHLRNFQAEAFCNCNRPRYSKRSKHPSFASLSFVVIMLLATVTLRSATALLTNQRNPRFCSSLRAKTLLLEIPSPEDMEDVGALLSIDTGSSDTLLLDGDLGSGKTCLSRGFVRARAGKAEERVTSPTYLLSNTYPTPDGILIHHMDLYRLRGEEDLGPLNMDHVLKNCISLIEWPSRLGNRVPETRLDVTFSIREDSNNENDGDHKTRIIKLQAHGVQWERRLNYLVQEGYIDDLLIAKESDL